MLGRRDNRQEPLLVTPQGQLSANPVWRAPDPRFTIRASVLRCGACALVQAQRVGRGLAIHIAPPMSSRARSASR